MKNRYFYALLILLLLALLYFRQCLSKLELAPQIVAKPERIISLSPSITETLFALGLDQQIVGVTNFCQYPEQALTKPKIADSMHLNLEALLKTQADLVILPAERKEQQKILANLAIPSLTLNSNSLQEYLQDLKRLGKILAKEAEAHKLIQQFINKLSETEQDNLNLARQKILLVFMHLGQEEQTITEVNIIGKDGFYDQLIEMAGAINAYQGKLAFPRLSREAILALNPDLIVDIVSNASQAMQIRLGWQNMSSLKAIQNHKLLLLAGTGFTIPGPRSLYTLEALNLAVKSENLPKLIILNKEKLEKIF